MTTATRSRSQHRAGSTSSGSHHGRRSSVGKPSGARGRFDPNLMMSSNAGDGDRTSDIGSRRKSVDGLKALERAARRNKSTDRLHRGDSSITITNAKRSKSSTQLAMAVDERSGRRDRKGKQRANDNDFESEDGWTSASAAGTPVISNEASPSTSPIDEGLVLGFKKRAIPQQAPREAANTNRHTLDSSPPVGRRSTDMERSDSGQGGETPRASAVKMTEEPEPLEQSALSDPAAPQVDDRAQATPQAPPAAEQIASNGNAALQARLAPPPLQRGDSATTLRGDALYSAEPRSPPIQPQHQLQAPDAIQPLPESPSAPSHRVADLQLDVESPRRGSDAEGQQSEELSALDPPNPRQTRSESPQMLDPSASGIDRPSPSPSAHRRVPSSASTRTVRSSVPMTSSPGSLRSRTSVLSSMHRLFPRENQGVAPPMLDTHNALAGALGSRHEDRGDDVGSSRGSAGRGLGGLPESASEPVGLDEMFPDGLARMRNGGSSLTTKSQARRKGSMSSLNDSGITLPSPSPSLGNIASTTASRGANDFNTTRRRQQGSVASLAEAGSTDSSGILSPDRRRTTSTQSLTAADAARLAAKLRLARDSIDEHSAASALRGASAAGLLSGGPRQVANPRLEKYNKPVISNFAKDQSAHEAPQAVAVTHDSVFSRQFARPHESLESVDSSAGGGDGGGGSSSDGSKAGQKKLYRYVMPSGLGGPPIEKSELADALLGPSLDMDDFESSWAPALANAAGLGSRSMRYPSRNVEPEFGIGPHETHLSVNGPNSTELHLIHGLTTTSPDPFPLHPSDVPALQEGNNSLFGVPNFDAHPHGAPGAVKYVEPALIRAIAMTSQAISTHRAHVVTRRYADPMRESLERMARSSGKWGLVSSAPTNPPSSPALSLPGGSSRWGGRKTAPNSPGGRGGFVERPGFARRQTSDASNGGGVAGGYQQQGGVGGGLPNQLHGHLAHLVDAAEHPVRSLKRVWSGGLTRGGLAALTSTREEA